jgi:hypothetical protein
MDQQNGASGVSTVAKDQAGQVSQTAAQAGGQVAQTTKEQAQSVAGEARQQARDLVGEARTQVREQAGGQKGRAVDGLRTLAGELDQMAQQGGQSGIATEVARQAAQRAHGLAEHLDRHEPTELLDQVRAYARRRPVAFLAGAAVLGVLAGRMTRNLASNGSGPQRLTGSAPALPASTEPYPADYGTPGYAAAGYPAAEPVTPAYPVSGAEAALAGAESTGGYEPAYAEPGHRTGGGFEQVGQPEYDPGYQPAPGYGAAAEPGTSHQPAPDYESAVDDPAWRSNP